MGYDPLTGRKEVERKIAEVGELRPRREAARPVQEAEELYQKIQQIINKMHHIAREKQMSPDREYALECALAIALEFSKRYVDGGYVTEKIESIKRSLKTVGGYPGMW